MRLVRMSGSEAELTNCINWGSATGTRRLSPGSHAHQAVGNKANSRAQRPARAGGLRRDLESWARTTVTLGRSLCDVCQSKAMRMSLVSRPRMGGKGVESLEQQP